MVEIMKISYNLILYAFFYKQLFFYISFKNCNIAEVVEEKPKNSPICQKGKRKQPQ